MRNPSCLRCKTIITMPGGSEFSGQFTALRVIKNSAETFEQSMRRQFERYAKAICDRVGPGCKVRIVSPCEFAQEC